MNKSDQKRLDIIHRLPCMACVKEGDDTGMRVEAHHIVDRGYREHSGGHQATLPLCVWHHRGEPAFGYTKTSMMRFGPSLAISKREFVARYGTERELLANINKVINESQTRT